MRILLINHEFPPLGGGAATAAERLAKCFAEMGNQVTTLTSAFKNLPAEENKNGYHIIRVPALRRSTYQSNPWEMSSFMLSSLFWAMGGKYNNAFDACIAFFGLPGGLTARALKYIHGLPYILSLRGGDVPGHSPAELKNWHRFTAPLLRHIWKEASAVTANSRGLRQLALRFEPHLPIKMIPNGVDVPACSAGCPVSDTPPTRLLFSGRLAEGKNIAFLLETLAGIREFSWKLVLVGDGPERKSLENLAVRLGISAHVKFEGWIKREEMASRLANTDIYVYPSKQEGMPNTVLEAMAAGLPVVAHPIEGIEDIITNGVNGFLAPLGDKEIFAAQIAKLAKDHGLARRIGAAARRHVAENYSWSSTARAYISLCEKAMTDSGESVA